MMNLYIKIYFKSSIAFNVAFTSRTKKREGKNIQLDYIPVF